MDTEQLRAALNGREIGSIEGRRPSAVLVPLVAEQGEDALLYEVRAATLAHQPGDVCFPGGRMEQGESARTTALRETREELGIPPEDLDVLGPLDYAFHISGVYVYPWLARYDGDWHTLRPNPAEVGDLFTIPLSWLMTHPPRQVRTQRLYRAVDPVTDQERELLEGNPRRERDPVLFWPYEGRLLWGMTARVTNWLVEWMKTL